MPFGYKAHGVARQIDVERQRRAWDRRGSQPGDRPVPPPLPCKPVITGSGRKGGHANLLVLRCQCMAQTTGKPKTNYYNYDPIGTYDSLDALCQAYDEHLIEHERAKRARGVTS